MIDQVGLAARAGAEHKLDLVVHLDQLTPLVIVAHGLVPDAFALALDTKLDAKLFKGIACGLVIAILRSGGLQGR